MERTPRPLGVCWHASEALLGPPAYFPLHPLTFSRSCHHGSQVWEKVYFSFTFFLFLGAAPTTYGSSWARGWNRAVAATLLHSHSHSHSQRSKPHPDLHCSLWQCWILNPMSEARDGTRILMDTSWVLNLLSHNESSNMGKSLDWGVPVQLSEACGSDCCWCLWTAKLHLLSGGRDLS